jgi:hypothetical protein
VEALLGDATRAGVVVVALDEPVVREESERLVNEVRRRGVAVTGVVLNRAQGHVAALPATGVPVHFQAPAATPPPIGVEALRHWLTIWTMHDA